MGRLEVYVVKTGERHLKDEGRPGWTPMAEKLMLTGAKNDLVLKNVQMLSGKEWNYAWSHESIGGNAGEMHLGVNLIVDRQTGEIIKFYNSPNKDPACGTIRFSVRVEDLPEKIRLHIEEIYFEDEFSKEAKQNIISAVEIKNTNTQQS